MSRFIDFPVIYGKLGNHPGLLSTEQAAAIFKHAMDVNPGGAFVEYDPDGGRSTVILATAAQNLDGKVYVFTNWEAAPKGAEPFFQRAYKTHRLAQNVAVDTKDDLPTDADLVVARSDGLDWRGNGALKPKKVLMLDNGDAGEGWTKAAEGQGWALWQPV